MVNELFPHATIVYRVSEAAASGRKFCYCALQRVAAVAAAVVAVIFALLPQLFFCELCSWHLNELVPGGCRQVATRRECANRAEQRVQLNCECELRAAIAQL